MINSPFINADDAARKNFDFSPWGGLEGFLRASQAGANTNSALLKRMVPDLAHAVDMTAVAVSGLPFDILDKNDEIYDTSTNWKNNLGGMPNPQRIIYLLASSLCGGAAYILPTRTPRMIFDLQYCAPQTIIPYIDINGLQYFARTAQQGKTDNYIKPKEIIYFWLPDSDVEIGPAQNHPLGNATLDAQMIWAMKNTLKVYGDRGFVPITLLGAKGMPNQAEREKSEKFFDRLLRGGFDLLAKIVNAETLSLIRVGAGMDELKQSYLEIRRDAKESVADSFGIPTALFMSDTAYASEFDALHIQWRTSSRFVGIYQTIEETLTNQLFAAYGYKMRFNPEALEIFQEDESNRAESLGKFVDAVETNPEVAQLGMSILGYDLDKTQEETLNKLVKDKEEARQKAEEQTQNNPAVVPQGAPNETTNNVGKSIKADETSAMIALRIPDLIKAEIQSKYPFVDAEILKDLHITLVYLGDNRTIDKLDVIRAVSDLGMYQAPIKGKLQGLARFVSGSETDPIVMTFDSPQAPKLYDTLCALLDNYHVPYHKDYGFIPHMTLAYIPRDGEMPIDTIEPIEINFSEVYYVDGAVWFSVDLVGYENKSALAPAPASPPNLSADEIKDLALWYDRAKQWHAKSKGNAVDWENKHLREAIAAPIRLKLAAAKNEHDIMMAFQLDGSETQTAAPEYKGNAELLTLAASLDKFAEVYLKSLTVTPATPAPAPVFNMTMPAISLTAQMPQQGEPSITVNIPDQPAPVVNVTNEVNPTPVTIENNTTVQPAPVTIKEAPEKGKKVKIDIERDMQGKMKGAKGEIK